jgi:hypothetical protein
MDGVLADFVLGFTSLAREMGYDNPVYPTAAQVEWDSLGGLTDDQVSRVWNRIKQDPEFWYTLTPIATPAERERVSALVLARPVYFVTARVGATAKWQTERWLQDQLGLAYPTVIMCSRKGDVAAAVHASHLIDDKAGNAVYTAYASPRTTAYLVDRQYNRFDGVVLGSRVRRVKTVSEFLDEIGNA